MKKRNKIAIGISGALLAVLIGGYFMVEHLKVPSSGKVAYAQPAETRTEQNLEISNQSPATSNQEEEINQPQETDNQSLVINKQESDATSHRSSVISNQNINSLNAAQTPIVKKDGTPAKQDSSSGSAGKIVSKFVSFGFQKSSSRTIKAIIIHTSYNALGGDPFDFSKVMQEWKDAGVSPHYAIDRDGTIYQLVADQNIAWHAGSSKLPDGTTDVNGASIGIEVINSQDAKFTADQYTALNQLIASLKKKYPIKYVLGHDDIAPGRKTDPWNIEWSKVQK